jgi:hypothetical protein
MQRLKHRKPNLPGEHTPKEQMSARLKFLVVQRALVAVLKSMSLPSLGGPKPAMQRKQEEKLDARQSLDAPKFLGS